MSTRRRYGVLAFLCLSIWISAIDVTIVNVALPEIGVDLQATSSDLQWVIDAFNVVVAGCVLLASGLADRYGRRLIMLIGLAVFGLGTMLAVFATVPPMLVFARVVMGLGVALLLPPSLALITVIFDEPERRRAIGVWSGVAGAGLALGPVIGGLLLSAFSWQSVFLVNLPVVVAAFVGLTWLAPESKKPNAEKLDIVGGGLSLLALGGLVLAIIEAPVRDILDPVVVGAFVLGVAASIAFTKWELHNADPMIELRILKIPAVVIGALGLFVVYFTFSSMMFVLPQYLQFVEGQDVLVVGLSLFPAGAVYGVLSLYSARATAKFGVRSMLAWGLVVMALGLGVLIFISGQTGYIVLFTGLVVYAIGWSAVMTPATAVVMDAVPRKLAGSAAAVNQEARQIGGAIGVAVVGSIVAGIYQTQLANTSSVTGTELEEAGQSLGQASALAATLPAPDAASLTATANTAFTNAISLGFVVMAALTLLAGLVAYRVLRPTTTTDDGRPVLHP